MVENPVSVLRIGILGASSIAPSAIVEPAARRTDVEVVAVAARRPGAARSFAERWRIPRAEGSYEAVLDDPAIDVVYVSLAASDHARWTIAALEAGKDVLCEKPASPSAQEALEMVGAAERAGRLLVEAFHYRWHPLFARVREIVSADSFGSIESMTSAVIGRRPFVGGSVLHDPALGGGVLRHSGCYAVHWMRLLAAGEPRVTGFAQQKGPLGADASSVLDLTFPGDARGRITSSFERDRTDDDPPDLVVESATSRIDVRGLISPHHGHSVRLEREGAASESFTVGGRTSYDHQLDALVAARADPGAAALFARDLVAQAAVLGAAYARSA
ncbi:Gfo/Idh/MocA family protein [Frondihabitans sucicola]|uniref:Gfo/Idh/MocA family protein n=1 Tax=Frondihabitans sucicola TaxID=1268041 RepID=UPI0025723E3C|nr:Gfo/Idh/MocA family oxidoreductase [Frondihabitans sucicola]